MSLEYKGIKEKKTGWGGAMTKKWTRKVESHFPPFSFCLPYDSHFRWEQEAGVGGGAVTQKLTRKVGSEQPPMRGHSLSYWPPTRLDSGGPRAGEKCPLSLLLRLGDLLPSLLRRGSTRRQARKPLVVVITDKPTQVRRNQADIGSLLTATQRIFTLFE